MHVCELRELMYVMCLAYCLTPSRCSKSCMVLWSTVRALMMLSVSSPSSKYSKDLPCLPYWSGPFLPEGCILYLVDLKWFSKAHIWTSAPYVHSPLQVLSFHFLSYLALLHLQSSCQHFSWPLVWSKAYGGSEPDDSSTMSSVGPAGIFLMRPRGSSVIQCGLSALSAGVPSCQPWHRSLDATCRI